MSLQDRALLMDLYELTMGECYLQAKPHAYATFDLFVRSLPVNRAYLIACGLEEIIDYITHFKIGREAIAYLRRQRLFSSAFLRYLSSFRFSGDLWAMPEGTVFFANEPLIRVTAPIIEAQIIETFFLNTINLGTTIASKASRVVAAAGKKGVYDFSLRRTHGQDAGIKVARASYLSGFQGTSNVLAGKIYGIPIAGTMAHSYVMSFGNELESFKRYAGTFPERSILLVDTYDTKQGIANAITVGLTLKRNGQRLLGIRLDSGDIVSLSKFARSKLDKAGLHHVKIFASGDLDECKIKKIVAQKAPVDNFGVGTHMGVSDDAPFLDVIYKISEVTDRRGEYLPTMKLSKGKLTYPGRKQVFRLKDRNGLNHKDIVALEQERIGGDPLLVKIIDRGRLVYAPPSLDAIRNLVQEGLAAFPEALRSITPDYRYSVEVSPGLKRLTQQLARRLSRRQ